MSKTFKWASIVAKAKETKERVEKEILARCDVDV